MRPATSKKYQRPLNHIKAFYGRVGTALVGDSEVDGVLTCYMNRQM